MRFCDEITVIGMGAVGNWNIHSVKNSLFRAEMAKHYSLLILNLNVGNQVTGKVLTKKLQDSLNMSDLSGDPPQERLWFFAVKAKISSEMGQIYLVTPCFLTPCRRVESPGQILATPTFNVISASPPVVQRKIFVPGFFNTRCSTAVLH